MHNSSFQETSRYAFNMKSDGKTASMKLTTLTMIRMIIIMIII